MKGYQSDLEIDRRLIHEHGDRPFVHVVRENGSHLYHVPGDDESPTEVIPFCLGRVTRKEAYRQYLDVLKTYDFDRLKMLSIYDGKKVRRGVDRQACVDFYRHHCEKQGML